MSAVALWAAVGALGGVGALARFLLDARVSASTGAGFPLGTLIVNLSGAIVLGILVGAALHGDAYLLAGTAVIGSYTTFSTWMLESHRLGENARRRLLALNVGASLVLGVAAVALGRLIGGG
jgi:fluoride exporter